jgi:nitrogen fixation-related uncharacterized protein
MDFLNSLGDGWTIYLWLIVGALIVITSAFMIRWAAKNEQFDEDIKYLVFTESDKDKMAPADFEKSREVLKEQEESRKLHLEHSASH